MSSSATHGINWNTGVIFDSSWERGTPTTLRQHPSAVIGRLHRRPRGPDGRLAGARRDPARPGLRGAAGNPPDIGGTDTIVFVVDILGLDVVAHAQGHRCSDRRGRSGCRPLEVIAANRDQFEVVGLAAGAIVRRWRSRPPPSTSSTRRSARSRGRAADSAASRPTSCSTASRARSGSGPTPRGARDPGDPGPREQGEPDRRRRTGDVPLRGRGHRAGRLGAPRRWPRPCGAGSEREVAAAGAHRIRWSIPGLHQGPARGGDPKEALAHPTWDMGLVVTTNSATLVNKGLEVVEAHLLFGVPVRAPSR